MPMGIVEHDVEAVQDAIAEVAGQPGRRQQVACLARQLQLRAWQARIAEFQQPRLGQQGLRAAADAAVAGFLPGGIAGIESRCMGKGRVHGHAGKVARVQVEPPGVAIDARLHARHVAVKIQWTRLRNAVVHIGRGS